MTQFSLELKKHPSKNSSTSFQAWFSTLVNDRLVVEDANSLREITTARMQLTHKETEHLFLWVNEEAGEEETAPAIRCGKWYRGSSVFLLRHPSYRKPLRARSFRVGLSLMAHGESDT